MNQDPVTVAQNELAKHHREYVRLELLADQVIADMEYHGRQVEHWNAALVQMSAQAVAAMVEPDELPETVDRTLRVIQGGAQS